MTLKQALWEIVRDENIIITNQNIDWLLDRALKRASGDAQALKESILERKGVIEENIPCALTNEEKVSEKDKLLLINEDKSNNFEVKSNEELFKQALVEGLNRRFDREIEEAKKIEQIEELAKVIDYTLCFGCNQEFSDEPCEPKECYIRQAISNTPTAEVVPKSEVEKWFRECEELQGRMIELESEVAREIFEEIYETMNSVYASVQRSCVGMHGDNPETMRLLGKLEGVKRLGDEIAELKKKYTESEGER